MRNPFRPLTESDARFRTSIARAAAEEAVQSVRDFEADALKDRRLEVCECRTCHYIRSGRIGGCAMTAWFCGLCGKESLAGSTNTPRVCQDCGKKHSICTHCGGDLDMRDRRRKWPTPVSQPAPAEADHD